MKKLFVAIVPLLVVAVLAGCSEQTTEPSQPASQPTYSTGGFNMYGYNYTARIFSGPADGIDKKLDGMVWGDATYANDRLVMKWNAEWDRGNAEGWSNPPYAAWENNEWNGQVPNGSGEVWFYKIIWVGTDLANSEYWVPGGYAIWSQFEVIFSHGTSANEHFWDVHATPTGFGN